MRVTQNRPVMMGLLAATASLAIACGQAEPQQPAAGAGSTAFEGARVIVGDGTDPIENATIIVRDGRIEQVGADVQVPEGATRVSLAGKTVMPGILDAHVHL